MFHMFVLSFPEKPSRKYTGSVLFFQVFFFFFFIYKKHPVGSYLFHSFSFHLWSQAIGNGAKAGELNSVILLSSLYVKPTAIRRTRGFDLRNFQIP